MCRQDSRYEFRIVYISYTQFWLLGLKRPTSIQRFKTFLYTVLIRDFYTL